MNFPYKYTPLPNTRTQSGLTVERLELVNDNVPFLEGSVVELFGSTRAKWNLKGIYDASDPTSDKNILLTVEHERRIDEARQTYIEAVRTERGLREGGAE